MGAVIDLLERPVYGLSQVDALVGLTSGTARRWIDGYTRGDKKYPPVVREESTGDEMVTWGEYVETRLLAEYRGEGAPMALMRPAVEQLRKEYKHRYPLAHAEPWLEVQGRELVMRVQEAVGLKARLRLVVVRNQQLCLAPAAERFVQSVDFEAGIAERIYPLSGNGLVVIDPLRQFGQPVVRSVPTEMIAEQFRAGDPLEMIAELYELTRPQVDAAIRYELTRSSQALSAA